MIRSRLLLLVMMVLLGLLAFPALAQDGGVAITATTGEGPDTFSTIYCTGTDCSDIVSYMYMGAMAVDPDTATIAGSADGATGGFTESWSTEDNIVYDVKLREDVFWSDGVQMTAADLMFEWDLINTPEAEHPLAFILDTVADVEMIDDFNLRVTMTSPACNGMTFWGYQIPAPSHILGDIPIEELENADFNLNPTVVSGQFELGQYRPAEITTLLTRDGYVDAPEEINLDGFIQIVSADATVANQQLLEGEINFYENISAVNQDEIREADNLQIYEFPGNTWDYMAFNLADPENPQPALDEDGNRIDQGMNQFFSDKNVRHAIGHAVDVDSIIEGAIFGNGTRMPAQITASSWAFNSELEPRSFDIAIAEQLLDEAGWVMGPDGVRICEGCLYATEVDASFEGSPFEFELLTNAGNTRREAIGTIIQDQLSELGIVVNFQTIEFNTLLDVMDGQTFDAFILGWRAGYPDLPDTIQLFGAEADVPGSGFNFTSFYNEEFFELEEQANTTPGCDPADRAPIYAEMQEIMYDEMPYLWLFSQNGMYAANNAVGGFNPFPQNIDWNIATWDILLAE